MLFSPERIAVMVDINGNAQISPIDNNEIEDLAVYLTHLYNIGADAIIVQDFGVVNLAKKVVPELPLHASTQMAVHNLEGVKFLETNPELEENKNIQLLWQDYHPVNHKRRRTYSLDL